MVTHQLLRAREAAWAGRGVVPEVLEALEDVEAPDWSTWSTWSRDLDLSALT